MAALAPHVPLRARNARFAGAALRARPARAAPLRAALAASPRAGIFDFLTPKPAEEKASASAGTKAYICVDCGYIYKCVARAAQTLLSAAFAAC